MQVYYCCTFAEKTTMTILYKREKDNKITSLGYLEKRDNRVIKFSECIFDELNDDSYTIPIQNVEFSQLCMKMRPHFCIQYFQNIPNEV
jgi:hypothetical protein